LQQISWYYHFVNRRSIIYVAEQNTTSLHHMLKSGIEISQKQGHTDVNAIFLILQCTYTPLIDDPFIKLKTHLQTTPPTKLTPILQIHALILELVSLIVPGKIKDALLLLPTLQSEMDSVSKDPLVKQLKCDLLDGVLMTWDQLVLVALLVSSLCFRPGDAKRSRTFLKNGLERIKGILIMFYCVFHMSFETKLELSQIDDSLNWFTKMEASFLHQLTETLILRSEFAEAAQTLVILTELYDNHTELLSIYQPMIMFDWALLHQVRGKLEEARFWFLECHQTILLKKESTPAINELAMISLTCCALLSELDNVDHKVIELPELTPQMGDRLKVALITLKAIKSFKIGEIKGTKVNLLDILQTSDLITSSQMKTIALTSLGYLFKNTDAKQSEKMFLTAEQLSKKNKFDDLGFVSAEKLRDLVSKYGDEGIDRFEKYSAMAKSHYAGSQEARENIDVYLQGLEII
ncbi:hypothetical protein HK096_007768, partial [Nowakowskiella sp. JEL0078]